MRWILWGLGKVRGRRFVQNEIIVVIFVSVVFPLKRFYCVSEILNVLLGKLEGKNSDNKSPCEWILETSPGKVDQIFFALILQNKEKHYNLSSDCHVLYNTGGNYLGICQDDE